MLPSGKAAATSRFHSASGRPSRRNSMPVFCRHNPLSSLGMGLQTSPLCQSGFAEALPIPTLKHPQNLFMQNQRMSQMRTIGGCAFAQTIQSS